ncbi:MAG: leucyl/phenylalanyl-tRNA--protein transferase [Nitrospirae bacterium RBG_16_64_22]|nr:MAG: leucyl/phenylalanyl-tRNA--protein transferase [Nitrospirae bacterium RBG_16_64_22]
MNPPLAPDLLEAAYRRGLFPMAEEDGRIAWYSPDPRGVFDLDRFHVPRRLERVIRSGRFEIGIDADFEAVIRACAGREETWLNEEMIAAYADMHRKGLAHSVEARREGRLAGGLYGVALGGAFMGESMFHVETDASKVCLAHLVERLRERGFVLLDTQFLTPHLARFGARWIPRSEYLRRLTHALTLDRRFG